MNIKKYNGLPLFSAEIHEDDMSGVYCVSLVTDPATELPFYAFKKEMMKYSVIDDKEHVVTGVIMLADTPILRVDENGDGYYVVYSKETLKFMAEKMLREGFTSSVNIEHDAMKYVDGVNLTEIYVIDRKKGIAPEMFKDAPDGTLVGTYKIRNDEVWDMVLRGEVYSFSLEGFFEIKPIENNNEINTEHKMSKIAKFIKSLVKFGQVETDKAVLYWEGEEEIAVGTEVFVGDEEKTPAEDGEYVYEEKTIVVKDGKVEEIREKEEKIEEPAEEEKKEEVVEIEAEEEVVVEDPAEPQPEERDVNAERIDALEKEVAELKGIIAEIQAQIAEILSKPAAEPIEESFDRVKDVKTSGLTKRQQKSIDLFKNYHKKN